MAAPGRTDQAGYARNSQARKVSQGDQRLVQRHARPAAGRASSVRSYVVSDPALLAGEPIVAGTKTPVRAIVEMWRMGVLPEEIPLHLPHLTLAQVFDALRYYAENQGQINGTIEVNRVPDELVHPLFQRERVAA